MSEREWPDFDAMADETLEAVKVDGLNLRDSISATARMSFSAGVRAARNRAAFELDALDDFADEVEREQLPVPAPAAESQPDEKGRDDGE